ncbi:SusD/RagB family nutrient-binding outer membrane lipoprotein [Aliifodinibius sp. S!AR15-10]|uniref:SusD/RagB family nutrient-binding outer membrane lipoprotein n=1 Tax=Aliifodinibius sp. S!AR15-10 TaxID=2950437 RepID=UPI002856B0DD|nr:SusD/RagB family nutrient-binding outer membrane lipoprotein [Aliifodinibius sp. S!AR15-10]MDR8393668.1 SusD/RagB family nutrient-binding outer membrane lipoprotein [Aliifodinibius sp. S!AR15-10]
MKKPTKALSFIVATLLFVGCYDQFEEINTDPNNPTQVPTSYLLSNAERELVEEILGLDASSGHTGWAIQYVQYWSNTLYTQTTRYQDVEEDWSDFYNGGLADLEEIIRLNSNPETQVEASQYGSNNNQIAVAEILQVWGFQNVTDIWGDIPFTEALKASENFSPAYDPQELVYDGLIAQLNDALSKVEEEGRSPEGDLIFSGDMTKWKIFANSLKLRIGMRLSEVNPTKAENIVSEAVSGGVIGSIDENVYFPYLQSAPNFNPWFHEAYVEGGSFNLAMTNTAIDKLKTYNDPRLYVYAAPSVDGGEYTGIPYGVESGVASAYDNAEVSFHTDEVYYSPGRIMTYSEVLLLQAEAAERNWISGDPATLYEDGIRASMEEWNVPDTLDVDAYLQQEMVAYDPGAYREKIGNQLWFALYMQPLETWAQWRRLDYPDLQPAPDAFRDRDIPRRRGYPNSESDLNMENYNAAVERQGPDEMSTRMWWDVE